MVGGSTSDSPGQFEESDGRGVRLVRITEGLYRRLFVGTLLFGIAAPAWGLVNEPLDRQAPNGYPRSVAIGLTLMVLAIVAYVFRRRAYEIVRHQPAWLLLPTAIAVGALWADGSLPSEYYAATLTPLLVAAMVVDLRWALLVAATLAVGHLIGVVVVNGHSFGDLRAARDLDDFIEQAGAYFVIAVLVALPVERLGGFVLRVNRLVSAGGGAGIMGNGEGGGNSDEPAITARLSVREIEVTELVADGLSNDRIAGQLYLSPRTVQSHVANAMRKTDTSSRTELAVTAVRAGLVAPRDG